MHRLKSTIIADEYAKLEGIMWMLRRKHECLSEADKDKLELLYTHSPILKQAHSRALGLTHIFNTHCNRKSATVKLNRWIAATIKSEIKIFDSFINTLQKYKPDIANYFKARKTSSFV
jgi:transposase